MQFYIKHLKISYSPTTMVLAALISILLSVRAIGQNENSSGSLVNSSHLDALYEEINVDGNKMGIIHIYSDYPDYKWIGDDDEGIACVDDVSRAAIFYINNYTAKRDTASLNKSGRLIRFLLYMQSDNGFFYNFIFKDHSINKEHKNSIAGPNWWSWRAMQTLALSYNTFKQTNPELSIEIKSSLQIAIEAAQKSLPENTIIQIINGIESPSWLPAETAGDQASDLVLALVQYHQDTMDSSAIELINRLCDGILLMQKGTPLELPFCAFLSWQNTWHAYGNMQSYALLRASEVLKRNDLKAAALNEINFFYPFLLKEKYLSSFTINNEGNSFVFEETNRFPQIAYNFRPIIYACIEAFKLTGDTVYLIRAKDFSKWFFGYNAANQQMYDPSNGICFDGIDSQAKVNKNSGAESTIEALLCMQVLEQFPDEVNNLFNDK